MRVRICCTHTSNPYGRVQHTLVRARAIELIDDAGAHTHASVRRVRYDYVQYISASLMRVHPCIYTKALSYSSYWYYSSIPGTYYCSVRLASCLLL